MYSQDLNEGEEKWIKNWVEGHVGNDKLKQPFQDLMTEVLKIRKAKPPPATNPAPGAGSLRPEGQEPETLPQLSENLRQEYQTQSRPPPQEIPHYTFQQVRSIIGCGYSEYEEARDILIHRYKENIFQKHSGAEEKENSSPFSSTNPSTKSQNRKQKTSSSTCLRKMGLKKKIKEL